MKTSWKSICSLLVLGGVACLAVGCKSGTGGSPKFENPFKSFASNPADKDKLKAEQSPNSVAGSNNPKPSATARPEVTAPLGGYGTTSAATVAGPALNAQPTQQPIPQSTPWPYAQSPYAAPANTAADPYAVAGAPVAVAYDQSAYAIPRDPRTGFQEAAAPAAQPVAYGQQYPAQAATYSVPEAYDGMYQAAAQQYPAQQYPPQYPATAPTAQQYQAQAQQVPANYYSQPQTAAATPYGGYATPEQQQSHTGGYAPATTAPAQAGPYSYR